MSFSISIPFFEDLRSPSGWVPAPRDTGRFAVVRFHYFLKKSNTVGKLYTGEPLADIAVPTGVTREYIAGEHGEIEVTDTRETVRHLLTRAESVHTLATELRTELTYGKIGLAGNGRTERVETFVSEFSSQVTGAVSVRKMTQWSWSDKIIIDGAAASSQLYLVSKFRQVSYDIILVAIDYLEVYYSRRGMQLRKRRRKSPECEPHLSWEQRPNVLRSLNLPLRRITVWEHVDHRSPLVAGQYTPEVDNAFEVRIEDTPIQRPTYTLPIEPVESLYFCSNHAFPERLSRYERRTIRRNYE